MKTAAVYARTSKEDRSKEKISIEQQVEDGRKLAKSMAHDTAEAYIDRDLSGKLPPTRWAEGKGKTRPALEKMLADIEAGKIGLVVVRRTDRLARNTILLLKTYDCLKAHGVRLAATAETLPEGDADLVLTILAAVAQYEREKIVSNVRAAKAYQKRHGMLMGPVYAPGYRSLGKGKVEINEAEAEIVREIYRRWNTGSNIASLVKWLNSEHPEACNFKGQQWYHSTLRRLLSDPRYTARNWDFNGKKEDWKLIASQAFPRILDDDVWQAAQEHIRTTRKSRPQKYPHLLSGLLKCAGCGHSLMPYSRFDKDGKRLGTEWKCNKVHAGERPANYREEIVDELVQVVLGAPLAKVSLRSNEAAELDTRIDRLEQSILELEKELSAGKISLQEYRRDRRGLETGLEGARKALKGLPPDETPSVKDWAAMDNHERRHRIMQAAESIEVYHDGVMIRRRSGVSPSHGDDMIGSASGVLWFPTFKVKSKGPRPYQHLSPEGFNGFIPWAQKKVHGENVKTPIWDAFPNSLM